MIRKILISGITIFSLPAWATDLSGHWQGRGTYQTGAMTTPLAADFDTRISQTEVELNIQDCWTFPDPEKGTRTNCYTSKYSLAAGSNIFHNGRKIGDIFPNRISIFQGNTQVSESMNFQFNSKRQMRFRYSYSNYDGEMSVRFAQLDEVRSP